jgi:hypothetical protein
MKSNLRYITYNYSLSEYKKLIKPPVLYKYSYNTQIKTNIILLPEKHKLQRKFDIKLEKCIQIKSYYYLPQMVFMFKTFFSKH